MKLCQRQFLLNRKFDEVENAILYICPHDLAVLKIDACESDETICDSLSRLDVNIQQSITEYCSKECDMNGFIETGLLNEEQKLCPICKEEHKIQEVELPEDVLYKDVRLEYKSIYSYCCKMHEFYQDEAQATENDKRIKAAYKVAMIERQSEYTSES